MKLLKLTLLTIVFCHSTGYAQIKNKFTSKDFIEKVIVNVVDYYATQSYRTTKYISGSMSEVMIISKSQTGVPIKVKVEYLVKPHNKDINDKRWVEVYYDAGLPFAITFKNELPYELPIGRDNVIDEMFSSEEIKKIKFLNKKLRENERKSSKSYKEVIKKHNSYPASYDIKNCLELVTYEYTSTYYTQKSLQIDVDRDIMVDVPHKTSSTTNFYKNVSNHPIVLKGISATFSSENNTIQYFDDSKIIQPEEIFEEVEIQKEYNDYNEGWQYVGDVGKIKNSEIDEDTKPKNNNIAHTSKSKENTKSEFINAKHLKTAFIEVDSYVNSTDINIKKGDKLYLKATGEITVGAWAGSTSPDGINGYTSYNKIQNFKHGSLLAKIGAGEWLFVGSNLVITAQTSGILQLMVNDGDPSNNSGSFIVEYGINKK